MVGATRNAIFSSHSPKLNHPSKVANLILSRGSLRLLDKDVVVVVVVVVVVIVVVVVGPDSIRKLFEVDGFTASASNRGLPFFSPRYRHLPFYPSFSFKMQPWKKL